MVFNVHKQHIPINLTRARDPLRIYSIVSISMSPFDSARVYPRSFLTDTNKTA